MGTTHAPVWEPESLVNLQNTEPRVKLTFTLDEYLEVSLEVTRELTSLSSLPYHWVLPNSENGILK